MNNEIIATGKTVEEAIENGCKQLNVSKENCEITVLQEDKKGILGLFGKVEAKVKIILKQQNTENTIQEEKTDLEEKINENEKSIVKNYDNQEKIDAAVNYLTDILNKMEIDEFKIDIEKTEKGINLIINGDNLGILIGRHGETLDSLQYLVSLACNRVEGDYYRISLDCGNYREKREETLKELAKKLSEKAIRTGKNQMLEPMNPYERRIIHAVVSSIDGVSSKSKGDEPYRKVVIIPNNKSNNYKRNNRVKHKEERTIEQILKSDFSNEEKEPKLYSKIEL